MKAEDVELQLAEAKTQAFTRDGWGFELKLDGFRLLAERIDGVVQLVLRRGRVATRQFPEIVSALEKIPGGDFILDGELVIQDAEGRPIFQRLLMRGTLTGQREIDAGARVNPAAYFAFDLLMDAGEDLRPLPLRERKRRMLSRISGIHGVMPVEHVEREGEALLEAVRAKELEGIVAKDLSAPYVGGRSERWFKIAIRHVADFAVVGYAEDLRSFALATWNGHEYVYAGRVGSGVTPKVIAPIRALLERTTVKEQTCRGDSPPEKDTVWCTPTLVAEVRYKNWPEGLSIREPTFLRLRDDKQPTECPTPNLGHAPSPQLTPSRGTRVSNVDKVLFPDDRITKGELVAYYRAVSPWLLAWLRDRPLMLTRFPDGITGKNFFQKAAPPKAPDFVRTVRVHNEEENRDLDQIVCDDARTLEWCANLATMPLHLMAGRLPAIDRADWTVIDFDPKTAPFEHVMTLALSLRDLCDAAGLPTFVKTSGSSGLHVMIPLGQQLDQTGARQLGDVLAQLLVARHPQLATVERIVKQRQGKVYVDAGQNGPGRLIASPFCVRPLPTAPVSMPIRWDEVTPGLTPRTFTIRNAIARLERLGDLCAPVLTLKPDLATAFSKLLG